MTPGPPARRVVCVTGMHRSGTSLVARVVNLLGVDLGAERHRMAPSDANRRGHWEPRPIVALNDDLLRTLGGSWREPPALADGWERDPQLDGHRAHARRVVRRVFGDGPGLLGWKDPRTSLLLPFWRTVTPVWRTVVVVRDPDEVVASLQARDGLSAEHAVRLWLRYTTAAWRADPERRLLAYEHFFDDCDAAVDRLTEGLGLPSADDATRARIAEFFDPGLRTHLRLRADAGERLRLARGLYDVLLSSPQHHADLVVDAVHLGMLDSERLAEAHHQARVARRMAHRLRTRLPVRLALRLTETARPVIRVVTAVRGRSERRAAG
ncbi:MAG: sulfotransferase [Actinomycetota bacterium]|nr:sulfotransferase [Actinomycetota bacterium]